MLIGLPTEVRSAAQLLDRAHPIPTPPEFGDLLGQWGLVRGSLVGIEGTSGALSAALALCAAASTSGSWIAACGMGHLSWDTAIEVGIDLSRVITVALPDSEAVIADALAATLDAVDIVLVDAQVVIGAAHWRRLMARVRERQAVVIYVHSQHLARYGRMIHAPDLMIHTQAIRWEGVGSGWGYGRARQLRLQASGRGRYSGQRQVDLWMPDPHGRFRAVHTTEAQATGRLRRVV